MQTGKWKFVAIISAMLAAVLPMPGAAQRPGQTPGQQSEPMTDLSKVEMSQVPMAARLAALRAASEFKLDKAGIDIDENGSVVYELKGKNAKGRQREVDVTAEGTLIEIEDEITMEEVPQAVKETLKRWLPNFTPTFIEKSQRANFQMWYEFEGKAPQGNELDIEISDDGERILIQTDTAG
jgi:hypothetical protein